MMTENATSMRIGDPIAQWDNLDNKVKAHVNEFNEGILEFNDDEKDLPFSEKRDKFIHLINKVSEHINEITSDFNNLHTELVKREKELNEQKCCCIPTSISGAFYTISVFNCCASAVSSVGNILTFAGPTATLRLTGLVIGLSADICGFFSEGAQNVFYMQKDEISRIAKLNEAARENALKFQTFLTELKLINEKQNHLLEALKNSNSLSYNEEAIDPGTNRVIDRKIRSCVKKYENFPEQFRRSGVCGRLVLQIIEGFPPNDPLYTGLKKLAEIEDIRDLPITLERVSYINPGFLQNRHWRNFEESNRRDSNSIDGQSVYTHQEIINYYKDEITDRFGLDEFTVDIAPAKSGKGFKFKIEDPKADVSSDSEKLDLNRPEISTTQAETIIRE